MVLFAVVGSDRPCCYGYILTAAKARRGGGRFVVLAAEVAASLVVASAVVGADGVSVSLDGDLVVGVGDGFVAVGAGGHVWMIWGGW